MIQKKTSMDYWKLYNLNNKTENVMQAKPSHNKR